MKQLILLATCYLLLVTSIAQNVGIGTTAPNPAALLHVNLGTITTKGFLVTGTYNGGTVPDLGAGARLMFYPGKLAFRAGNVNGTQWDNSNVGTSSVAKEFSLLAIALYPNATELVPTLELSHCVPVTFPARKANLPG